MARFKRLKVLTEMERVGVIPVFFNKDIELAKKIDEKLGKLGVVREEREPAIHVTLGRVKKKLDLKQFLSKHKNENFGEFYVKEIKLKKVTLTPDGPIYEDI